MRCLRYALSCLLAAASAGAAADPMRPLTATRENPAGARAEEVADRHAAPPQLQANPRDIDRLVAIRQDSAGLRKALFGERWVRTGDKLERATVVAIDAKSVQLVEGGEKRTLHLLLPLARPGFDLADASQRPVALRNPISDAAAPAAAHRSNRADELPTP